MSAVVSLHSHSSCSRENLSFIPVFARRVPLLSRWFDQSMARYQRLHGRTFDFSSACWRPPLSPAGVVASEREQAERRFELDALVSLTDHDTLEGPRQLRALGHAETPLSFEWSVPYEGNMFHLGVHGIAPARVDELEHALKAHTARGTGSLDELLDALAEWPDTVVVLNHPFWDLTRRGQLRHDATLLAFLRRHSARIHGLELNGYRSWTENRRVLPLAEGFGIPLVGGGDRHGYAPNGIVNLTHATCFAEFARELREERRSHCVVLPEYTQPFVSRCVETARDVLAHDGRAEGREWQDRVFYTVDGVEHPVRGTWMRPPAWVRASVSVPGILNSPMVRAIFAMTRADGARTLAADCGGAPMRDPASRPMAARPSAAA